MTIHFHFAPLRLGPGSIIEPGNFGRLIKRYSIAAGAPWLLARELIFEQLRPEGKPARMGSCFALPTRAGADAYRAAFDSNCQSVLHEVEIDDGTLPQHMGGLSFLDMPPAGPFLDQVRAAALSYWSSAPGAPEKGNELVTASALRVVRALE